MVLFRRCIAWLLWFACLVPVNAGSALVPVLLSRTQWGYIDSLGKVVVPARFDAAKKFTEGLAAVKQNGLWGYIDSSGQVVLPFQWSDAGEFSEGLASASKPGSFYSGYINLQGQWVSEQIFMDAMPFSEGLAAVRESLSAGWGYINREGKYVITPRYKMDLPHPCREGRIAVQVEGKWGFADASGTMIVAPKFHEVSDFCDGLAMAQESRKGVFAYDELTPPASSPGLCGYIDLSGQWVIKPEYTGAYGFSEGLASVEVKNDKWGFIDRTGQMVVVPAYDLAQPFREGLSVVLMQDRTEFKNLFGYIDAKGRSVIAPKECFNAFPFYNGLAEVISNDNGTQYINRDGRVIWSSKK